MPREEPIEVPSTEPARPDATVMIGQAIRVVIGGVALALTTVADVLRLTLPTPPQSDEPADERPDPVALAAGAFLGALLQTGDRVAELAGGAVDRLGPPLAWIASPLPLGRLSASVERALHDLDEAWQARRPAAESAASSFARELVPQVVDAVLDQIDLTWLVAERVDVDQLVAAVDVDAIVRRIDVDAIVASVDLNRVAERIDVDAVADRLDLDRVIDRLDLAAIAREVIDEIDLAGIIREATEAVTNESIQGIRVQSASADRAVQQAIDRVLGRRAGRDLSPPTDEGSDGSAEPPPRR
jgi:hypothetical protein